MWKKLRCETIKWHTFLWLWVQELEGADVLRSVYIKNNELMTGVSEYQQSTVNNRLNDRSDCVSPDKLGRLLDAEPLLHMVHRGDDWKSARILKCVYILESKGLWFLSHLQYVAQPTREPGEGRRTLHLRLLQWRPWVSSWSWFSGDDDILQLPGL